MEAGFHDMRVRESEFGPKWSRFGLVKGKPTPSNNNISPPPKSRYLGDSEKIANLELQIAKLIKSQDYMQLTINDIEELKCQQRSTDKIMEAMLHTYEDLIRRLSGPSSGP